MRTDDELRELIATARRLHELGGEQRGRERPAGFSLDACLQAAALMAVPGQKRQDEASSPVVSEGKKAPSI